MDDNLGSGIAFGNVYDTLASLASQTAILSNQPLALGLLFGPLLPPCVTAIACGDDGDEEGGGRGEFDGSWSPAHLGAQKVQIVIIEDHQRVLFGLNWHA